MNTRTVYTVALAPGAVEVCVSLISQECKRGGPSVFRLVEQHWVSWQEADLTGRRLLAKALAWSGDEQQRISRFGHDTP